MSDFQIFFDCSSALKDKLAVDVVSRLKSSAKAIDLSECRNGLFDRIADSVSGRGKKRQSAIDSDFNYVLSGVVGLVEELIESHNLSGRAIIKINEDVKTLSSLSAEFAVSLQKINHVVYGLNSKINDVEKRLDDIKDWISVKDEVEYFCDRLRVNQFHPKLSPASRIYCLLEDLKWGDFGWFYAKSDAAVRKDLKARLEVKVLGALKDSVGLDASQRVGRDFWFSVPDVVSSDEDQALIHDSIAFLGSWANPSHHPIVCSTIEYPRVGECGANDDTPWVASSARIATLLSDEVFSVQEAS